MTDKAWGDYWDGARAGGGAVTGAKAGERFEAFTEALFLRMLSQEPRALILDIASGAGVLSRSALRAAQQRRADARIVNMDLSPAALDQAVKALGPERCAFVAADAAAPPFAEASFTVVASQFGVEYAGSPACVWAARLVRPGGWAMLILHRKDGPIHQECEANRALLETVIGAELLAQAAALIRLDPRGASPKVQAQARFQADLDAVAAHLRTTPDGAAAGYLRRLLADMAALYNRRAAYALEDALAWLEAQSNALRSYADRMRAMGGAALSEAAFKDLLKALADLGFDRLETADLTGRAQEDAAWVYWGRRR